MVALFGTNDKTALNLVVAAAVLAAGAGIGLLAPAEHACSPRCDRGAGRGWAGGVPARPAGHADVRAAVGRAPGRGRVPGAGAPAGCRAAPRPRPTARPSPPRCGPPRVPGQGRRARRPGASSARASAGPCSDGRAASAASAGVTVPAARGPAPTHRPGQRLRHRRASRRSSSPTTTSTASTPRSSRRRWTSTSWTLRVHGMVDREVTLTFDAARGAAARSSAT